jgi:peroxiredoxin Q/BCP
MMAIGIRRGFPVGGNTISASARGPLSTFCARDTCAGAASTEKRSERKIAAAGMTARTAVLYNDLREGVIPMDINDKAPEFTLPDQNGENISLKDLRGKYVVLYFYPRADTPGCTIEACEFRDTYSKIKKTGAVLLGISPDTPKAQKKFEEKFSLPFQLLGDADKKIANSYGVMQEKNMYGKKVMGVARTTFIIGPDGKIKHIFKKVKAEGHAEEVLEYLKTEMKGAA